MSQLKFYYKVEDLFKQAMNESLYYSTNVKVDKEKQFDDFAISYDDESYFNDIFKEAAEDVFSYLSKLAEDISNAFQFKEDDLTSTPSYNESNYVVYFITKPDNWDNNISELMDVEIKKALINYALKEWFERKGVDTRKIEHKYDKAIDKINEYRLYRKKLTTRTRRTF